MLHIGVIPGDGIGPEVIEQALRVLAQVAIAADFSYRPVRYPFGAGNYLENGELVSEVDLADIRTLDAVLLGALGDRRVEHGLVEHRIMGALISELDLGIAVQAICLGKSSLCPIKNKKAEDVNFVVVKQNPKDVVGNGASTVRTGRPDELALSPAVYMRRDIENTVRYAYSVARERPRHHLTSICGPAVVPLFNLWGRVVNEVARDFPDVQTAVIDTSQAVSWMLKNPEWYDVIVAPDEIGETLMCIGTQLQGGVGFGALGLMNPSGVCIFTPVHGPATRLRGTGLVNPIGAIMALSMLLKNVGQDVAARMVASAVYAVIRQSEDELFNEGALSTSVIGDLVLRELGHRRNVIY